MFIKYSQIFLSNPVGEEWLVRICGEGWIDRVWGLEDIGVDLGEFGDRCSPDWLKPGTFPRLESLTGCEV